MSSFVNCEQFNIRTTRLCVICPCWAVPPAIPSRNPPAIHPQSTHKQTRPCARGHALLPARCFALAFFPPAFPTHKKPRQKHRTPTHRPQGRVCFSTRYHAGCSGVLQSTRNPPAIHAQANPTLRPRPCPPPCSVFRLGFFSSRISNTQKAKAKTPNTHTPPARSGLLLPPHPFGLFGGVRGVNSNGGAIGIVSSRGSVSFLPQSHPSRLSFSWHRCAGRWRRRHQRRHRCAGSPQGRFSVVLVAAWLHLPPLLRGCVLPLMPLFAACISHRGFLVSASGCSLAALFVVVSRCVVVLAPMRGVRGCSKVFAPRLRLGCLSPSLRLGNLCTFVNYTLQMYRAKCPKHFLT